MDADQIRALVEASSRAAVEAALASVQQTNASKRRPDLPDFDIRSIDIWIKRVESAYTRANVTAAKEKFAHLEAKIGVDVDPKINEFLFGDATDDSWTEFLKYLRQRYGRSKKQQAATILDGVKREGRLPTQLLSVIKDRSANVSIDDLHKELILRELPEELQRILTDDIDTLTAQQLADKADKHFDKDGRLLIRQAPTTSSVAFSLPFSPEELTPTGNSADSLPAEGNINAAFKPRGGQQQRPPSASRGRGGNRGGRGNANHNRQQQQPKFGLCKFHERYGDKAYRCEAPCLMQTKEDPKAKPEQRA